MDRVIRSWNSPSTGMSMGVGRWGHHGKPVVWFPTGGADFLDVERFKMVAALAPLIDAGRIKLYAPDSTCRLGWAAREAHPRTRIEWAMKYDKYLTDELIPYIREDSGGTTERFAACGASIGAFNALNVVCRHPEHFDLMLGMSGTYVMDRRMDGYWDEDYYFHQPTRFLPDLDGEPLRLLQNSLFILGIGQNYENPTYTDSVEAVLKQKHIPHRVERWGSASGHDWPTWRTMLPLFLNRTVA